MQKDFHYYAIRVLAEKAGFCSDDAQTIAYASQYVDDATEHKEIELPEKHQVNHPRINGKKLDPICTAHKGLQFINAFKKDVQMKIYLSFHFLPPEEYTNQKKYSYVTTPNSPFAQKLINWVKNSFDTQPEERTLNLIKLGIAMHSYADTWAHSGFSGRHSSRDNDIEKIEIWNTEKWKFIGLKSQILSNSMPDIGHAEAYSLPDLPYETWQYRKAFSKKQILKHNLDLYIDASEKIYEIFLSITKKENIWNTFSGRLIHCFSYANNSIEKRNNTFIKHFPEIGFYYDDDDWKNEILKDESFYKTEMIEKRPISLKWLLFHQAALEQRNFVMENIKPLL